MEKENFIITLEEQQIVELLRMYTENNKDKNIFAERALHLTKFSDVLKNTGVALELLENLPLETENKRGDSTSAKGDIFPCWTIQVKKPYSICVTNLYMNLSDDKKLRIRIEKNFDDGIGAFKFIAKTLSTRDNSEKREIRERVNMLIYRSEKHPTLWHLSPEELKILKEQYAIWNNNVNAALTTTYILPKFR